MWQYSTSVSWAVPPVIHCLWWSFLHDDNKCALILSKGSEINGRRGGQKFAQRKPINSWIRTCCCCWALSRSYQGHLPKKTSWHTVCVFVSRSEAVTPFPWQSLSTSWSRSLQSHQLLMWWKCCSLCFVWNKLRNIAYGGQTVKIISQHVKQWDKLAKQPHHCAQVSKHIPKQIC